MVGWKYHESDKSLFRCIQHNQRIGVFRRFRFLDYFNREGRRLIRVVITIDESKQHVDIKTDRFRLTTKTETELAEKMENMMAAMMKAAIETQGAPRK